MTIGSSLGGEEEGFEIKANMSERSKSMSIDSSISGAEEVLDIDGAESMDFKQTPSHSRNSGGHDDHPSENREILNSDIDDRDAESVRSLSRNSNDSFLESLMDEATPEFTFVDTMSRVSVLSLLSVTHKNLKSLIHIAFEGIKDPDCRITRKLYDLYDEEDQIVNAETWDYLVQPGSTITMKYRNPEIQSLDEKSTNVTRQGDNGKAPVDTKVPPKRYFGKHNKSIYRRKKKEKAVHAARVAKAKEEGALSHANIVESGRRMRGKTFFRDRTKPKQPQPARKVTQPPAIHFETAVVDHII